MRVTGDMEFKWVHAAGNWMGAGTMEQALVGGWELINILQDGLGVHVAYFKRRAGPVQWRKFQRPPLGSYS